MDIIFAVLLSVCVTELIHNSIEIWGMRQKLSWLSLTMQNKGYKKWPIDIDSKTKVVLFHLFILAFITAATFMLLSVVNIANETLVVVAVVLLLINYVQTTYFVDKWHEEIGKILKNLG